MTKYDWEAISEDFIQGVQDEDGNLTWPTLKELHEKYGGSYRTIRNRSSSDKWSQKRDIYKTKLGQRTIEKKIEKVSGDSVDFDSKALDTANEGLKVVEDKVKDEDVSEHQLLKLSVAAVNFQRVGKLALGEPTDHSKTENENKNVSTEVNNLFDTAEKANKNQDEEEDGQK